MTASPTRLLDGLDPAPLKELMADAKRLLTVGTDGRLFDDEAAGFAALPEVERARRCQQIAALYERIAVVVEQLPHRPWLVVPADEWRADAAVWREGRDPRCG